MRPRALQAHERPVRDRRPLGVFRVAIRAYHVRVASLQLAQRRARVRGRHRDANALAFALRMTSNVARRRGLCLVVVVSSSRSRRPRVSIGRRGNGDRVRRSGQVGRSVRAGRSVGHVVGRPGRSVTRSVGRSGRSLESFTPRVPPRGVLLGAHSSVDRPIARLSRVHENGRRRRVARVSWCGRATHE